MVYFIRFPNFCKASNRRMFIAKLMKLCTSILYKKFHKHVWKESIYRSIIGLLYTKHATTSDKPHTLIWKYVYFIWDTDYSQQQRVLNKIRSHKGIYYDIIVDGVIASGGSASYWLRVTWPIYIRVPNTGSIASKVRSIIHNYTTWH